MITIIMTKGAPASLKSTWSKAEVAKNPAQSVRINNDDIRSMLNSSIFDPDTEKLVSETRKFLIREAIKRKKQLIIIDNVNANKRHWEETISIVKSMNVDANVFEKVFYSELEELLERNAKREWVARVPDEVVKKFFNDLGGKQFKLYQGKQEVFTAKTNGFGDRMVEPLKQDESAPRAVIIDIDGSLAIVGDRSPYSAENCDVVDRVNQSVADVVKLYYNAGYRIIFCSGRMEKDRAPTVRFIEKHLPNMKYVLFLRKDGDYRKDAVIKEEILNEHILPNYYVAACYDDRLSVCQMWFNRGLNLFRIGDPDADF